MVPLLPAVFNVGSILGPVLGSILAQGGVEGTGAADGWFGKWPFLLLNTANAAMKLGCVVFMGL